MGPREILLGGVVPGCIAGVILLLAWWRARRRETGVGPRWLTPVAFLLAYLPADWAINSWPRAWPVDSTLRFPHAAAILALLGIIDAVAPAGRGPTLARRAALYAAAGWVVISGLHPSTLGARDLALWVGGTAIGLACLAGIVDRASARLPGWSSAGALVAAAAAAGPIMLWSHTATFAQQSAALVAALSAAVVVGLLVRRASISPGGVSFALGLLGLLVVSAWLFGSRRPAALAHALVLLSPGAMAITLSPIAARWPASARGLMGLLACLAIAGAAAIVAALTRQSSLY